MNKTNLKIAVSGDVSTNVLTWRTFEKTTKGYKWENSPYVHSLTKEGGALLLSELVSSACEDTVISPKIADPTCELPKDLLQSTSELGLFSLTGKESDPKVYRIKNFLGYSVPTSGKPILLPIVHDDEQADMVIIHDEDNGFHSDEAYWPLALESSNGAPIVIYKVNHPTRESKLWNHIEKHHIDNTIVVIDADDFRAQGVNISKSLSWERTAIDFAWQINNNPNIAFLAHCQHLIIHFGLEGAIYYQKNAQVKSKLFFLPYAFEGDFIKENQGNMFGLSSCFVAGLAGSIASGLKNQEELSKSISKGIRSGIVAAQKYFINGFGEKIKDHYFCNAELFRERDNDFIYKEHVQDVNIRSTTPNCRSCWYIIKDKASINLAEISYNIVKYGEKSALKYIPIAQFGKLKTVDRTEIEAYRSIKNLITEYVSAKSVPRPLSIAVFGTPGSGKSFGVTEVASSIAPNLIEKLDFNLSQFQDLSDLTNALHRVRDVSLMGKIPLVFFDEFDSAFNGKLGWLKYFLAPMQDGVFRVGGSLHPIGKAIFVFAGGTSSTYQQFGGEEMEDATEYKRFITEFKDAKGPDFISRLRGYVNILGPNQTDEKWDLLFIVRRAMLLRSLLERKTPDLIDSTGEAQIDNGVLRALLKLPRYKHETRSMEAILEMSRLSNAPKWEQSLLPSKEQLKLHVDEEQFYRHLMYDSFFSEKVDHIAAALYQKRELLCENDPNASRDNGETWDKIKEEVKQYIRSQIRHLPGALTIINYELISVDERPENVKFLDQEVELLAEYEHKKFTLEKKEAGWRYGKEYDVDKKTDPMIVSWDCLHEIYQNHIIDSIKAWPEILAKANFKIEKLQFMCYCDAQMRNRVGGNHTVPPTKNTEKVRDH
ncbi:RyR domain-containing protein [Niallia sp. Krafla_26]|uniref:RyR domain-containing protein n=1 Tax=Niallia sp. Krafla_26 TaxID=3064703 RepID=UPI003D171AF2